MVRRGWMLGGGEEELQGAHLLLHGLEEDHLGLEGGHHLHHHLHPGHSQALLDLRLVGASYLTPKHKRNYL